MIDVTKTREALEIAIRRMDAETSIPLRALAAALKDGVIVPREPTEAMIEAWCQLALNRIRRRVFGDDTAPGIVEGCKEGYRAMLAAAPTAEHKEPK